MRNKKATVGAVASGTSAKSSKPIYQKFHVPRKPKITRRAVAAELAFLLAAKGGTS